MRARWRSIAASPSAIFSQDVGEMSGRSAVSEVMDGAGPVSSVAAELRELGGRDGAIRPGRTTWMISLRATGEVQGAVSRRLDGYALEGRAREVLAGLSFSART